MKRLIILFIISLLTMFNGPLSVSAEGEKSFSVTSHKSFTATLGYLTSTFISLESSGVAFNVSDEVAADIDTLVSATVTYESCELYSFFNPTVCWNLSEEKQHVLRYDEFATFDYIFSGDAFPIHTTVESDYYSLGLTSAIVNAQEETSYGSMVYVIPDSVMRNEVAAFDYYMIFDQPDVYNILLIEISYISKATTIEEVATCTSGCEFGDGLGSQPLDTGMLLDIFSALLENINLVFVGIALIAGIMILNTVFGGLSALITLLKYLVSGLGKLIVFLAVTVKYLFIGLGKTIVFLFKVLTFPFWVIAWLKHRHDAKQLTKEAVATKMLHKNRRYTAARYYR